MSRSPSLADLTTLRIGGPIGTLVEASTEEEIVDAVWGADTIGAPLLVLGGGSNLVVSDEGFPGVVVRDRRTSIVVEDDGTGEYIALTVVAGTPWDDLVARAVEEGWVGVEAMSGIPGSTGATPVQNVGAYGQEVYEVVSSVRVWDRAEGRVRTLSREECGFTYRDS
ncbi:MAG: FAD-binding protein, partial [Demequinaceae bacterium]|nr:FAD-binding protein [Demequinaceae bacterium]